MGQSHATARGDVEASPEEVLAILNQRKQHVPYDLQGMIADFVGKPPTVKEKLILFLRTNVGRMINDTMRQEDNTDYFQKTWTIELHSNGRTISLQPSVNYNRLVLDVYVFNCQTLQSKLLTQYNLMNYINWTEDGLVVSHGMRTVGVSLANTVALIADTLGPFDTKSVVQCSIKRPTTVIRATQVDAQQEASDALYKQSGNPIPHLHDIHSTISDDMHMDIYGLPEMYADNIDVLRRFGREFEGAAEYVRDPEYQRGADLLPAENPPEWVGVDQDDGVVRPVTRPLWKTHKMVLTSRPDWRVTKRGVIRYGGKKRLQLV